MNSFEISSKVKKITTSVDSDYILLTEFLSVISEFCDKIFLKRSYEIFESKETNSTITMINDLKAKMSESKNQNLRFSPKNIFMQLNDLRNEIRDFNDETGEDYLGFLLFQIDDFTNAYEEYVKNYNYSSTTKLLINGKTFSEVLKSSIRTMNHIDELMTVEEKKMDINNDIIILEFKSYQRYTDFKDKLNSIYNIYDELCLLLNISTSEYPLEIVKIESGSLFSKIFGQSQVIKMMTNIIEKSISFIYRNSTVEGKINNIPKKVEAIEAVIGLENLLHQNNIDTSEIKENIAKASVQLSNDLNKLLSHEPVIKVNDKIYSFGVELENQLLENKTKYLSEGNGADKIN